MKRTLIVLSVCVAALPATAPAADDNGAYWSQRAESCRAFRSAIGADTRTTVQANIRGWIAGYLTAYNRMAPETYDILGISDIEAALQTIETFCKANPLENLTAAMELVTEQFHARRHQTKRQAGR